MVNEALKSKIDASDNEIDLIVYKLYDLTYDEVLRVAPQMSFSKNYNGWYMRFKCQRKIFQHV
jgi:hypothetical protein